MDVAGFDTTLPLADAPRDGARSKNGQGMWHERSASHGWPGHDHGHDHEPFLETINGCQIVKTGMNAERAAVIGIYYYDGRKQNGNNDPPTIDVLTMHARNHQILSSRPLGLRASRQSVTKQFSKSWMGRYCLPLSTAGLRLDYCTNRTEPSATHAVLNEDDTRNGDATWNGHADAIVPKFSTKNNRLVGSIDGYYLQLYVLACFAWACVVKSLSLE
jgi:hypothetical protein